MLEGVQILLDRMDTNPEEFDLFGKNGGKWRSLIEAFQGVLTDEERTLLAEKGDKIQREMRREKFTAEVLKGIMGEEERVVEAKYAHKSMASTITLNKDALAVLDEWVAEGKDKDEKKKQMIKALYEHEKNKRRA